MFNLNFSLRDQVYKVYIVMLIMITIYIYYHYGAKAFPDYQGYLLNADPNYSGYFFEYLARAILTLDLFGSTPEQRLDVLAFVVQSINVFLILLLLLMRKSSYALAIFCSIYLPLLMTTVLRAGPLYIFTFFVTSLSFRKELGIKEILVVTLFGVFFHDSVLLISVTLFLALFICKIDMFSGKSLLYSLPFLFFMILFNNEIKLLAMNFVDPQWLGHRDIYLLPSNVSLIKYLYSFVLILLGCFFLNDSGVSMRNKLFLFFLLSLYSCTFILSNVVAIRLSIFYIGFLLSIKDCFLHKIELKPEFSVVLIPVLFFVYVYNFRGLLI
ncbi:hypothetical protein [Endozoicomonas euniceicola]|uniref:EpsG family protein n=1 Tax=Endozoicomonas euniceicola TaxID=1234143 RepID=A0ABY6GWF9_9GAMM|nr:hypothetical protein [Endozoicomonas euniceicola]UYM16421.1 hypothetical protein NX720_00355 [Endozoicomonas euniceicola]